MREFENFGGKHVSAAPVSFEKSSHPSRDTQRSSWGRCNHTATSHSLSFSDLRRGTSASPLPSRTSRRRSRALKGHARGTRGRHTMRLSHRASHARPPSTPVNPPARQGARCLSAPAFLSGSRGLQLRRPQACSVPSRRTAYTAMRHARPVGLGIPSKRLRVRRSCSTKAHHSRTIAANDAGTFSVIAGKALITI